MKTLIALSLLLVSFETKASLLPKIFSALEDEKASYCADEKNKSAVHWRTLMSQAIMSHAGNASQVKQNGLVSLSYLELFQSPSTYVPAKFMGYVYANASHHLGRLVRFMKWPSDHPLKDQDRELVKGKALRLAAGAASHELSKRLMSHSLELYKELSWSLGAAILCGNSYALEISQDKNLRKAFTSKSISDFIEPFVTYEQTYLQNEMYSDFLIGSSAKAGVLDEMRFISFNGEEHPSYYKWKKSNDIKETSFDLEKRIEFDTFAIKEELAHLIRSQEPMSLRAQNAKIVETAKVFIESI